mmetsp:Transcript_23348/g.63314  ORF Transcript_23348/g.63314 Transcript_23348/m.63314 type:complete len:122 (-) Transcript_23348:294-659(-)
MVLAEAGEQRLWWERRASSGLTTGTLPRARVRAHLVYCPLRAPGDKPLNDIVVFDSDTDAFLAPPEAKNPPEPRSRHTLELVGSDLFCILGYKLDWACGPEVYTLRVGNSEEPLSRIMTAE